MSKERKHYIAEEKVAVLGRHLLDKVRERSGRVPIDRASSPPGGGETETD